MNDFSPIYMTTETPLPPDAGSKVINLQNLAREEVPVPTTLFLPAAAYTRFVHAGGLLERIRALTGEAVESLRWEEIWDAALALRNSFARQPVPRDIAGPLLEAVRERFGDAPLAVRSCAPYEDSGFSHAGMHDTILDVRGEADLLRAVRLVWASLWTDRTILYRREMGLSATGSGMGVMVQTMVAGDLSGVMFTRGPVDDSQMVIEAAEGMAKSIVDDALEGERTVLDRGTGRRVNGNASGSLLVDETLATRLYELGKRVESLLGSPQDVEWTLCDGRIVVLQSRPVTTLVGQGDEAGWGRKDKRPWYLSLTRSHGNLTALRERVERDILPAMLEESERMREIDLSGMGCDEIARELAHRSGRLEHWRDVYWRELIPLAHAVRQFGMLYNDAVAPDDPFEFTALLSGQPLLALERNSILEEMTVLVQGDAALADSLAGGRIPEEGPYTDKLAEFMGRFGDLACSTSWCDEGPLGIVRLTLDPGGLASRRRAPQLGEELEHKFLSSFHDDQREFAESVLELARAGYRLRDDDNIYLGRIQARHDEVVNRARQCGLDIPETVTEARKTMPKGMEWAGSGFGEERPEALRGWAAAVGIARGAARVVTRPQDLFRFQQGEVLVCDALDPNMTFVVPLASAIVERRGGMLVHGAIIAREYGIPCVTGIADATSLLRTGEELMVDGFRGVVSRERSAVRGRGRKTGKNVYGDVLASCCVRPMTGFYRTGLCDSGPMDAGSHVVCARVTPEFLEFTRSRGNDLSSPSPESGFPGLVPGDRWCLCALRWKEALMAGVAPPVILESTHETALKFVGLEQLEAYALEE